MSFAHSHLITISLLASLPALSAKEIEKPDFNTHVRPILEAACFHCHNEKTDKGGLNLSTLETTLAGGDNGTVLVPGKPAESSLYSTTILDVEEDEVMPPKKEGLLSKSQTEILRLWIEQGANWPKDVVLQQNPRMNFVKHIKPILDARLAGGGPVSAEEAYMLRLWTEQGSVWPEGAAAPGGEAPKPAAPAAKLDGMELVKRIHAHIVATSKEKTESDMQPYDSRGPKSDAPYSMVVIKGGEFLMGSPDDEAGRKEDEGPQVKVQIKPFWMGKYEVTWDEYSPFMVTEVGRNKDGSKQSGNEDEPITEIISQPTTPYTEMSFGMGTDGYPAISMTQHAANKFCQWLSAQTGHFYRLPTEQEWEYAARAGTTTAYYWGNDPAGAKDHEWYYDNAPNFQYSQVGKKKPNPWGLHDMLGNVVEWTLDQYTPDYYKNLRALAPDKAVGYYVPSTTPYPHTARGGSFDDDIDRLRAAARRGSSPDWKQQDPQLPKSIWYHTDAKFLGFRIVRPLEIPSPEEMFKYWNNGVEKE
jgi:formylglycine-generating enzyme required for sulfatase activity